MKKILIILVITISTILIACDNNYSYVESRAEYYYRKGQMYRTIDYTVGLSSSDYAEMERINAEENAYINYLSSAERRAYFNKLRSLDSE